MRSHLMRAPLLAVALLSAVALTACAGEAALSTPPEASPDPSPAEETAAPATPTADISEAGLAALVARAAEEAGVAINEVRVVTAEEVTWSDGSLGCPEPGKAYTQALVPGFRVVLEIDGEELNFHAAQGGEFRFCEDPQPPVEGR
ncbi:MAG: hypothetical protein ABI841_00290 [Chloroflexota bacterium]